jgi:hypothetical protein
MELQSRSPDSRKYENPLKLYTRSSEVSLTMPMESQPDPSCHETTKRVDLHTAEFVILVGIELYTFTIVILTTLVSYCNCYLSSQGDKVRIVYASTTVVRAGYSVRPSLLSSLSLSLALLSVPLSLSLCVCVCPCFFLVVDSSCCSDIHCVPTRRVAVLAALC